MKNKLVLVLLFVVATLAISAPVQAQQTQWYACKAKKGKKMKKINLCNTAQTAFYEAIWYLCPNDLNCTRTVTCKATHIACVK